MSSISSEQQPGPSLDRPAGGQLTIESRDRRVLSDALQALVNQDSRRFCDVLWIGLGDRWRELLARLSASGYVALIDPESADGVRITDRGRSLAARLMRAAGRGT